MDKQDALSEEIVIVGSRHGELADVFKPIYEKGDPIKGDSIEGLLGFDDVILSPADNSYDGYAVGVYTSDLKLIGHVWMCQSPSVRRWLDDAGRDYLKAHITRLCVNAGQGNSCLQSLDVGQCSLCRSILRVQGCISCGG